MPIRRRVLERLARCWLRWAGVIAGNRSAAIWSPAVQVTEDERDYVIHANLPRWMGDSVQVTLQPGVVSLRAESHAGQVRRNGCPLQLERASDVFERAFRLPPDVEPAGATAEFSNGRLSVRLPRQAAVRAVPVSVRAGTQPLFVCVKETHEERPT